MRKYLFIMTQEGLPWGGSEPLWSSAAEHLVRRGNEVRVSAKDWGKLVPQIERLRSAGCRIFYRDYRIPTFFTRQVRRLFPPRPFFESHMAAVGGDADLVVVSSPDNRTGFEWMESARAAGRKYAVIAQSAVIHWWPEDDIAERLAEAYENACGSYFVSQAILEISRWQFGTALEKAKVVRNPFNVSYDASPPWPASPPDGELALAFVGRLDVVSKGQDVLLQVLAYHTGVRGRFAFLWLGTGPTSAAFGEWSSAWVSPMLNFAGSQTTSKRFGRSIMPWCFRRGLRGCRWW